MLVDTISRTQESLLTTDFQSGPNVATVSPWRRLLAWLGFVAVLGGSVGQVAHVHGDWLPHRGVEATGVNGASLLEEGGEAGCPLCIAMHSAAVVAESSSATPLLFVALAILLLACEPGLLRWHFVLFCRPPPTLAPLLTDAGRFS